jgi:hypothetical protein
VEFEEEGTDQEEVKEPPAIQAAAPAYRELLCAPDSLTLHLPAEEGDCQTALVTTRHLVTRGREAIPQLDGQDDTIAIKKICKPCNVLREVCGHPETVCKYHPYVGYQCRCPKTHQRPY